MKISDIIVDEQLESIVEKINMLALLKELMLSGEILVSSDTLDDYPEIESWLENE